MYYIKYDYLSYGSCENMMQIFALWQNENIQTEVCRSLV